MGAYICAVCGDMYCHHEVNCYEHEHNQLVCEDCYEKITEGEELAK